MGTHVGCALCPCGHCGVWAKTQLPNKITNYKFIGSCIVCLEWAAKPNYSNFTKNWKHWCHQNMKSSRKKVTVHSQLSAGSVVCRFIMTWRDLGTSSPKETTYKLVHVINALTALLKMSIQALHNEWPHGQLASTTMTLKVVSKWHTLDWAVDTTDLRIMKWCKYIDVRRDPILDARTRLQMSHVNTWLGGGWWPVLRWARLTCSDCTRLSSKTDTCFLNKVRHDDLLAARSDNSNYPTPTVYIFISELSNKCKQWITKTLYECK